MAPRENPFPFPIKDLVDLPESYQAAVAALEWPRGPIDSILMLPAQPFLKPGGVPRQALLSTADGLIHIREGNPPVATYLQAEQLLYVRQTLVLLWGSIEFVGERDGQPVRFAAEYNTVGQNFLTAALNRFLMDQRYESVHTPGSAFDQTSDLLPRLTSPRYLSLQIAKVYRLSLIGRSTYNNIKHLYYSLPLSSET